jgi:hypothetical protein
MKKIKKLIKQFLPFGFVQWFKQRSIELHRKKISSLKKNRISELYSTRETILEQDRNVDYNEFYEGLFSDLISRGLNEKQIRLGSMPLNSLLAINDIIKEHHNEKDIIALHIGNFVGVSLSFFTKCILDVGTSNSLIISIDPNLPHRGIDNPMSHVNYLLSKYRLNRNSMILCGYSLEKSISNDGEFYTEYDSYEKFEIENAPENAIENLLKIKQSYIDLVLIDGILGFPKEDNVKHQCIAGGDGLYLPIAAASILAKVSRDNYVKTWCSCVPSYLSIFLVIV